MAVFYGNSENEDSTPDKLPWYPYPLNRRCIGPRASVGALEKRNLCCHCNESNPNFTVFQLIV
jgi:hypothetical protein